MKAALVLIGVACLALAVAGCKKEQAVNAPDAAAQASDPAADEAAAQAARDAQAQAAAEQARIAQQQQEAANAAQAAQEIPLSDVSQAVSRGQYDGAVSTLSQLSGMQSSMSDEDKARYQQALRATTEALMQAKERDAAAKAAYQRLGRQVLGR